MNHPINDGMVGTPDTEVVESKAETEQQGVSAEIQADALLSYQQRLLAHLERHKRYPYSAKRRRMEGVALLRFQMNRDGQVLSYSLQEGSGHQDLDKEVLAMIKRAGPLPAFPAVITARELELVVPVEFFLYR